MVVTKNPKTGKYEYTPTPKIGSQDGFSSADPALARGPQVDAGTYTKLFRRGGSKKSTAPVKVEQGFSSADPALAKGPQVSAGEVKLKDKKIQPVSKKIQPKVELTPEQKTKQRVFRTSPDIVYRGGLGSSIAPSKQKSFIKGFQKPTTFGRFEKWFESKRGIARDETISPRLVKAGYDWGAEYTLRGGELLGGITGKGLKKVGVSKESFLFKPLYIPKIPLIREEGGGLSRAGVRDVLSSIYTFTSLSPFIKTGTAQIQESAYAGDVVEVIYKGQRVKMTAAEAKKLGLKQITRQQATGEFGRLSEQRQVEILKKAFKGREGQRKVYLDRNSLLKDVNLAKKFMRESGLSESQVNVRINTLFPGLIKQETSTVGKYAIQELPQMKRIDVIQVGTKTAQDLFQPSQVGQTQWANQMSRSGIMQQSAFMDKLLSKSKTAQDLFSISKTKQDFAQPQDFIPSQDFATSQDFIPTRTITPTFAPTSIPGKPPSIFRKPPIIPGKPPSIFRKPPIIPGRPPSIPGKPTRIPKIPVIPFIGGGGSRVIATKKSTSWIPQVKSKGKWKTIGKRMDRGSALSRASKGADLSTSRRMRIKPSNKPAQIIGLGGWKSRQHKFRPYRKIKGRRIGLTNEYIEKTSSAIDTPTEVSGLSIAKLSKQMNWLGSQKKKSKSKKKAKSPWLV